MTRTEMAALLRKIAAESRDVVAPFEMFAFKRIELGDLDHIASLLEGEEE